jgi:hypothetical protein
MGIISTGINAQGPATPAAPGTWNINGMTFDSWLQLNHNTELTITQHPVETGAPITDHSFSNPWRFSFTLGMTDTATTPSVGGTASRSVNAYNAIVAMQQSRQFLTLTCKYGTYRNILIQSINATDDWQTVNASRLTVVLQQVIVANTDQTRITTAPQTVNQTSRGNQQGSTINRQIAEATIGYLGGAAKAAITLGVNAFNSLIRR